MLKGQLLQNTGKSIDVSAWSMFFSFDVMGDVGFGKDFNNLNSGVEHPAIKGVHDHMKAIGILNAVPWFTNILGSIPGAAAGYNGFFSFCSGQIREKHQVRCMPAPHGNERLMYPRLGMGTSIPKISYHGY